jgi:hypothetical protein
MSVFGAVYQLNLAAAGWFQANAGVEGVSRIDPVGAGFVVVFLVAAVVMIRELRPVTSGRDSADARIEGAWLG